MSPSTAVTDSRVFDGLTDQQRSACLGLARTHTVKRRAWVARQGDPASAFYVVERGALKVIQESADGTDLIVRFVGPGDPFGGVIVLAGSPYPVSAVAVEATTLLIWHADQMRTMLERYPGLRNNIMREMTAHMTDALTRVREMTTQRVGQRLAMALLRLARQCGRTTDGGILITHTLTRQELADLTGTTLYTVSRTLSQWEQAGVLSSAGRVLTINSLSRLEQLSRGA